MSQSDDLSKLFERFGGKAEAYQEIVRDDEAAQARERWPLLSSVRVDRAAAVPPVQPAGAPAQDGAAAAPFWRAPAEPPVAAVEKVISKPPVPAPAAAMEPRFRTPGGTPPPARAADAAPAVAAPLQPPAWEPAPPPAPPAPLLSSIPSISSVPFAPSAPAASPAPAAGTELSRIFARLEGRPEPAPAAERAPGRRSFLDRLNRS